MNILICGDSWGCGVWKSVTDRNDIVNVHSGLETFLQVYGYNVTNLSKPGISNYQTLMELKKIQDKSNYDFIIIFFTNPFRDLIHIKEAKKSFFNMKNESLTFDYIKILHRQLEENFYKNLEQLDLPLYLIGGHNKITTELVPKSIKCLIPSVREYLYPNFIENEIVFVSFLLKQKFFKKFNIDLIDKCYANRADWLNLPNIHKKYFSGDPFHLDAEGHLLLAEYINNYIKTKN